MIDIQLSSDGIAFLKIAGIVKENIKLDLATLPPDIKQIRVDTSDVRAITSIGISSWIQLFGKMRQSGIEVVFEKLNPVLFAQVRLFGEKFISMDEVEEIGINNYCADCQVESLIYLKLSDLRKETYELKPLSCGSCQKPMEVDDDPIDYIKSC